MKPKKRDSSWKNLEDYNQGKDRLKHAILQHPEEDAGDTSIYNYMKGETNRSGWIMPFNQYREMGLPKFNRKKKK